MSNQVPLLNVQIDGVWLQFPKGTRVIEACSQAGKFIPRYCYHPKLSAPGNCRMCMVELGTPRLGPDRKPVIGSDGYPEIAWIPRPQISCAQDISEGMGIRTNSPMVQECRQGVMEFLLINHPLDCPICDQAGECRLQEFSVEYGNATSRFLERKVKKPKSIQLGPRVTLDAERCILCSRCIRFMKEVAHDDVLGFVDRGSFSTIACHPERTLDSNYSLNTVDICPVGALTSTDFRFKMRVWFLKETKSIDVNDGLGCNITIGSRENKIYRITPRENNEVNGVWIPDSHRLNFKYLSDPKRITRPLVQRVTVDWKAAISSAREILDEANGQVALLASARSTNEELYLARLLRDRYRISLWDIVPRREPGDGILIPEDRNPNTNGAILLGLSSPTPGDRLGEIASAVQTGAIKTVISLGEDLSSLGLTPENLKSLQGLIAMSILPNPTTDHATVVLPSAAWAEKRGSMININGRLQRLNKAIEPPDAVRDDLEVLSDLIASPGEQSTPTSPEDIFREMAHQTPPLQGLTWARIGDQGIPLNLSQLKEPEPTTQSL